MLATYMSLNHGSINIMNRDGINEGPLDKGFLRVVASSEATLRAFIPDKDHDGVVYSSSFKEQCYVDLPYAIVIMAVGKYMIAMKNQQE